MFFAQVYARFNHIAIAEIILSILGEPKILLTVNTVHNYISPIDMMIRKGAIASYKDSLMVIPFNMEDGLLICRGKSNEGWNFSAPHGAGRIGSRAWAKENLNLEQARAGMSSKGIYSSNIPIDETKGAYKSSEMIKAAIGPTAEIIHQVRPILNIKA